MSAGGGRTHNLFCAYAHDAPLPATFRLPCSYELTSNLEHEYAAPLANMSVWFDQDAEVVGADKLVAGGYENIVKWLLRGLDVRLGQVVTKVDYGSSSGVT